MSSVKRVYVEKKPEYAVRAKELQSEIRSYLGISGVTKVRELKIFPGKLIKKP